MKTFYTYLWLREDGTPYYAGKGSKRRAFRWHKRLGSPPPNERIVLQYFTNETDAFAAEVFLILFYGRKDLETGCLRNLSGGGENPPRTRKGRRISWGEKIKATCLAKNIMPPNTKGMKLDITLEARQAKAERMKGNTFAVGVGREPGFVVPIETRAKISNTCRVRGILPPSTKGMKLNLSPDQRRKRSERLKGNKFSVGRTPWNKRTAETR